MTDRKYSNLHMNIYLADEKKIVVKVINKYIEIDEHPKTNAIQ